MRPGSVTHHSDGNQRCVELDKTTPQPGKLRIIMPTKSAGILPRGYYMLFIVNNVIQTTQGVPSKAFWVEVRG